MHETLLFGDDWNETGTAASTRSVEGIWTPLPCTLPGSGRSAMLSWLVMWLAPTRPCSLYSGCWELAPIPA